MTYGGGFYRTEFTYDGLSRLRSQLSYTWNGSSWVWNGTTRYIYDGRLVIQERNSSGTPVVAYTRGPDLSGTFQGAGGIGGMLARSSTYQSGSFTNHHAYHADSGGNITALVATNQTTSALYRYDSFGNLLSQSGTMAGANFYRFSSKMLAADNLYHYGFRFYDPSYQRWINQDPLGQETLPGNKPHPSPSLRHAEVIEGPNLYFFNANSPFTWVDPDGRGKIGVFIRAAQAGWKQVSKDRARKELAKNKPKCDVKVEGSGASKDAKNLAKEQHGRKTVRHDPHDKGQMPHYQHKNGGLGKVFYKLLSGMTAAHWFGDNLPANAVDFFNPASDIKDIVDLLGGGSGESSGCE